MVIKAYVLSFIYFISFSTFVNSCSSKPRKVCNTKACQSISKEMLKFMDLSINPCHDFNKFACGGFEKKNRGNYYHSFQKPMLDLPKRIKKLLDGTIPPKDDFETDRKVINFYQACKSFRELLDKDKLDNNWTSYMAVLLKGHITSNLKNIGLSGWPFTSNDQLGPTFRWYDVVTKMIEVGLVYSDGLLELPILTVEVGPDDFDRDLYVLKIDSPKFEYITNEAGSYYLHTTGRSGRFSDGMKISLNEIMNIVIPGVTYGEVLKRSLEIDIKLEPINEWSPDQILGSLGHKHTRDYGNVFQVDPRIYNKSKVSSLDPLLCGTTLSSNPTCHPPLWTEYFNDLFRASGNADIKILSTDTVIVKDTAYFDTLNNKLKALNIQPYEMANYLGWKHVIDVFNLARNIEDDFKGNCVNYLLKGPENTNRRTENGLLNAAVGSMYIRSFFDQASKETVEEIVTYVKRAAHNLLENIDWMDQKTKEMAIIKLKNMKQFVGYPNELRNKTVLDNHYKNLVILDKTNPHAHAQNIRELAKFLIKSSFANMRKKWDPASWTLETHQTVNVVNAFYSPFLNEFTIPAGYLQDFNYKSDRPMYLNFATTATTIGHEIIHGFDNNGRNFDENGKKQSEPGWWSKDTFLKYNEKSACVINQYSQFEVKQLPSKRFIDGKRTLGENLADIGGNRIAYHAYLQWKKDKGDKHVLPNLPDEISSAEKLFWIRAAQRFCSTMPNYKLVEILNDETAVHTVLGFRTNGSTMFSPEFANDFNCPDGSTMNPSKSCTFWDGLV